MPTLPTYPGVYVEELESGVRPINAVATSVAADLGGVQIAEMPTPPPIDAGLGTSTVLVMVGCRSNDQQDLITRELRMQEDQLYAMEDYISQYQQLVCKYRSENAALRRQMEGDYYEGDVDELPRPGPSVRPSDERRGPTFRAPQTPRRSGDPDTDEQVTPKRTCRRSLA